MKRRKGKMQKGRVKKKKRQAAIADCKGWI